MGDLRVMEKIFINGALLEADKATISVDERGFRFGDGVFETIPIHYSMPYLWDYHQARLEKGLNALRITYNTQNLLKETLHLLEINQASEGLIRIYISRGIGSMGYLPSPSAQATCIIQTMKRRHRPDKPLCLWMSSYEKISAKALPVECKLAQGANSTLARLEARDNHCDEALQLSHEGYIAETSAANIFWLKDTILHTPSLTCGLLGGVTRRRMIELSPYEVQEGEYTIGQLQHAEAVILTNSSTGIRAVNELKPLGITWQSEALAQELTAIRNQDITENTKS
jgi:branched-subunit amino acid aminotransferase/4-amino-4-deoxychorismate lyase